MISKLIATEVSAAQTLSRPSVVARTLSELETVGCKITWDATMDILVQLYCGQVNVSFRRGCAMVERSNKVLV